LKRSFAILCCLLAATAVSATAEPGGPGDAIMAPLNTEIAATVANNAAAMGGLFTPDAVVVDDFAPYVWTGANAGSQWWTAFQAVAAKAGLTHVYATAQPITQYNVSETSAYVVVPLVITYELKGKPQRQTGLWTFTLRKAPTWKIVTLTWAALTRTK
jgi:hypothetical protein